MIRLWDFQTCACGATHRDEPIDAPKIPKTLKCACGKRVGWASHKRLGQIHRSVSTLYARGQVDPQTGVDYESYEHKKQTLKELGREEVGIERIDDIMSDAPEDTGMRDPNVGVLDATTDEGAIRELKDKLNRHPALDRQQSGNPGRPMQDSWVSFDPKEKR